MDVTAAFENGILTAIDPQLKLKKEALLKNLQHAKERFYSLQLFRERLLRKSV